MNNIWYNGSKINHSGIFDFTMISSQSGMNDRGFAFTSNRKVAELYADPTGNGGGFVSAYEITTGDIVEYDAEMNDYESAKWHIGYKFARWTQMQEIHFYGLNGFSKTSGIVFKNFNEVCGCNVDEFIGDTLIIFPNSDNSIKLLNHPANAGTDDKLRYHFSQVNNNTYTAI
jgi:hypothetical protein